MSQSAAVSIEQSIKEISLILGNIGGAASLLAEQGCAGSDVLQSNIKSELCDVKLKLSHTLENLEKEVALDDSEILLAKQLAEDADSFKADSPCTSKDDPFAGSDLDESCFESLLEEEIPSAECSQSFDETITDEILEVEEVDKKYLDVLKHYFGFTSFKPMQWKIIEALMNEKKDQLVVMATGYGKSLCYQFASVYSRRVSVVISPLLSLMEDQVLSLMSAGVSACQLSSTQTNNHKIKEEVLNGQYRIVYMTPERVDCDMDFIVSMDKSIGVDLIAIDEAHCVSQWGHDFRPSYRAMSVLKETLPNIPVLALTATATPPVRKDICKSLKLNKPAITCTGFDRPNLYLSVTMKSPSMANDLRSVMKAGSLNKYSFEGSTVIYCPTRKKAENCQTVLQTMGVDCELYHAGKSYLQRRAAHKNFVNDKTGVIIATVAFGMGIDKPDVRRVIHYGAPKDIESYYQEIGRAGRDGNNSECITFYSHADFNTSKYFLKDITSEVFRKHKMDMFRKMEEYLSTSSCRRRQIIAHFEDQNVSGNVGGTETCCDNCRRNLARGGEAGSSSAKVDVGNDAFTFLKAVQSCKRFGMATITGFIVGSKRNTFTSKYSFLTDRVGYGTGSDKSETYWKALGTSTFMQLKDRRNRSETNNFHETPVSSGFGSTISVSTHGQQWIELNRRNPLLELTPNADLAPFLKYTKAISKSNDTYTHVAIVVSANQSHSTILPKIKQKNFVHSIRPVETSGNASEADSERESQLFNKLIEYRAKISEESDVGLSTFMIATNKNLVDIAKFRPTNMENLLKVDSLPKKRAEILGQDVLNLIKEFAESSSLDTDLFDRKSAQCNLLENFSEAQNTAVWALKDSPRNTYLLYQGESKSLEEVAGARGFKPSTIVSHLCEAIEAGLPVDVRRLGFTSATQKLITEGIRAPPVNSDISKLSAIKENLPEYVTYDQIKITLAILKYEYCMDVKTTGNDVLSMTPSQPTSKPEKQTPSGSEKKATAAKRSLPIWLSANAPPNRGGNLMTKKKKSVF